MAANGAYSRGMFVIIHKLVLRRNLANNTGGRGGIWDKIDHVF